MVILNVEVVLKTHSNEAQQKFIINEVKRFLTHLPLKSNQILTNFTQHHDLILQERIEAVIIGQVPKEDVCTLDEFEVKWYLYTLDSHGSIMQTNDGDGDESEASNSSTHVILPSAELFGLWESLYYEENIKENLLNYAETMMKFSDRNVNINLVNCNRVILLHGPPGTGKTSLCKALAQKLSIRMQNRYSSGVLVEVNSHTLFSKWYSESGKLVTKMFSKITEIVQNHQVLVCLLIDEIESLAHARNQCLSGNEPSDSIRVVNALLTQLDYIRQFPNVLIFTTSNITGCIDVAFIDRADIKQYLGLPTTAAIYKVYSSCLEELMRVKIIEEHVDLAPVHSIENHDENSSKLWQISELSLGLSGRSLRKIPFLAHALYYKSNNLMDFLNAIEQAVQREKVEKKHLSDDY